MPKLTTILAGGAGALAAAAVAAVPAVAATTTNTLTPYTLRANALPVPGAPSAQATGVRTRLLFPTTWTRQRSSTSATLKLRIARNRSCQYTLTARNTIATSALSAAAVAAQVLPATGARVLEAGTRNSAVWRVTRPAAAGRVDVEGVRVIRHFTDPAAGVPAGQQAYLVTRVSALSDAGDECHSGTYRAVVGPGIGDALATERSSAYIRAKTG